LIQLLQAHFHTKKVHDVPPAKTEKNR